MSVAPRISAAVDDDGRAGDIGAGGRGKEGDQPGDFVGGAEPAKRHRGLPTGTVLFWVAPQHGLGRDRPGRDAHGPDPNRLHSRASPAARFSSAARAEAACTIEAMPRRGENAMKNIAPERCGIIALTATSRVTAHAASTAR